MMLIMIMLKIFLSFLTSYFLGKVTYNHFSSSKNNYNLISIFHSLFLGFGLSSITFWFYTLANNGNNSNYYILESIFVLFLYLYLLIKSKKTKINDSLDKRSNENEISIDYILNIKKIFLNEKSLLLYIATIIIGLVASLSFLRCWRFPDGVWDAIAMWNFKAKFLATGNESWTGMFSDYYANIHRDYPLLLSCLFARINNYIGNINGFIPMFFAWLFTISCFFLPYLYLKQLKNDYYALLSVFALIIARKIVYEGSTQCADIPLAVFFLISIYELIKWRMNNNKLPWLCVIFSSFCFWIKNEGIPWFIINCLFILYYLYLKEKNIINTIKDSKVFIAAFPAILSVLAVRYLANSNTDIVQGLFGRLGQILELQRYKLILMYFKVFIIVHYWIMFIPIFFLFNFIDKRYRKFGCLLFIILFQYFSYFFAYLITPHDLFWHLNTSFYRISTTLLPSLAFLGSLLLDINIRKK